MSDLTERERRHLIETRILEGLREVGVLFVAFAPLDVSLNPAPLSKSWPKLVGFLLVGILLFLAGVFGERRLQDVK